MATGPTLAQFLAFVRNQMGIRPVNLPDNSIYLGMAFAVAVAIVNTQLKAMPIPQNDPTGAALNPGARTIYDLCVYYLAVDNLINFAQDPAGYTYFARLRKKLNINGFVSGVVQASADETTSVSMVVQDAAKDFTLMNLQQLKTPYGRTYLGMAQSYGPSTWGIS